MIRNCQNDVLGQFINAYKNNEKNNKKCSYGPSYVQLNFNFQILNIQKICKFIKCVKRRNTKSPWESYFWKFEIRHTRPTASESELLSFFELWQTCKIVEITSGFTFKLKFQKHIFTYATVNAEIWRAKTCHKNQWEINKTGILIKTCVFQIYSNMSNFEQQRPDGYT